MLSIGEYEESLISLEKVLELKPDWLGAHSIKISTLLALKRERDMIGALLTMIGASKEVDDKDEVFSTLFNQILDSSTIDKVGILSFCLEYYKYINGTDGFYLFFSGIVDSNQGYLDSASNKFSNLSSKAIQNLGRHATGALTFRYGPELERISNNLREYNTNIHHLKTSTSFSREHTEVIFAACDSKYFDMFSEVFVSSFAHNLKKKYVTSM